MLPAKTYQNACFDGLRLLPRQVYKMIPITPKLAEITAAIIKAIAVVAKMKKPIFYLFHSAIINASVLYFRRTTAVG